MTWSTGTAWLGGDPCPGSVDGALHLASVWEGRAADLTDAHRVLSTVNLAGQGGTVIAAQTMIQSGASVVAAYRDASENCSGVLKAWAASLSTLQSEAHRLKVREAQASEDLAAGKKMLNETDGGCYSPAYAQAVIDEASARIFSVSTDATDLHTRYTAEGQRIAAGLVFPTPDQMLAKAGLAADTAIGSGALLRFLQPGKDPKLAQLRDLYSSAHSGDSEAQAQYLAGLASLTPTQAVVYSAWQKTQAQNPLAAKNDVNDTKSWWASLNDSQRAVLITTMPGIIGNLNGVPYSARDTANRALLDELRKDPNVSALVKSAVEGIDKTLNRRKGKAFEDRSIVSFELNEGGKPLGAIAIGDLDTASNITWDVPGMGTAVAPGGIDDWTTASQKLYDQQWTSNQRYGQSDFSNAMVSWVGYETPDMVPESSDVFLNDLAWTGSEKLAVALDGFYESRVSAYSG